MTKFALAFALAFAGCSGIQASAIDGSLRGIVSRHKAYTEADTSLSDLERRVNLRDGELLIDILEEARK